MIAGTTLGARRSDVASACWMVARRWVLVVSKGALPRNLRMIKDVIMREIRQQGQGAPVVVAAPFEQCSGPGGVLFASGRRRRSGAKCPRHRDRRGPRARRRGW